MQAIYAIGSNGSGQLGIGHREDVSVPKPVRFHPAPPTSEVVSIAAGGNHTLLLTQSGELYWSGDGSGGACGITRGSPDVPVFQLSRLVGEEEKNDIGPIALITATWSASFIVSRDSHGKRTKLFSFGMGTKGELGAGELIVRTPAANLVPNFPPQGAEIVDLAASMGHVVAVLDNGDAYGWGNCRKAQLGEPQDINHEPRKINNINFKVTRAVCTKETTCLFSAPDSGHVCILGSDKWGIISQTPKTVSSWVDVKSGWGAVYMLMEDGTLRGWGRDDHGQLPPTNLPGIKQIAAGSEHAVALSEDGDVLAWGWGEHGNCGPQVDQNDVKGRWNVIASSKFIPAGSRIAMIGAGCATSWICIRSG
ncbi:hypothetical protein E4U42_006674 [Claviceps africana]|uniref:RCC1-like domain-containing protein n=1 Tax=Claviceps africana TaxID=83212 RepID=A0A8K0JFA9_9HYPO|nr:hypothetical protein E4U42_006674 [Claviceps africana]